MADLLAIGYPDEATAEAAADEARRLAHDLIIQPDAIAVISRNTDGSYHVHTNHHPVGAGATWGMFWGFLFGLLFSSRSSAWPSAPAWARSWARWPRPASTSSSRNRSATWSSQAPHACS